VEMGGPSEAATNTGHRVNTALRAAGIAVALSLIMASCASTGATDNAKDQTAVGVVVRVIDGDTVDITIAGGQERIRLIGIDTPEPVDGYREAECYGIEASGYTKRMLPPGTRVHLERDIEGRDAYGRMLAYIYREQDDLFMNLDLVEGGYADDFRFEPNSTYADLFADAANTAKQLNLGFWGACGGPDRLLKN